MHECGSRAGEALAGVSYQSPRTTIPRARLRERAGTGLVLRSKTPRRSRGRNRTITAQRGHAQHASRAAAKSGWGASPASVCNSSHQKNPRHTLFLLCHKKEKCQTDFRHAITSKYYNRCFTRKLERFIELDAGLETLRPPCQ